MNHCSHLLVKYDCIENLVAILFKPDNSIESTESVESKYTVFSNFHL